MNSQRTFIIWQASDVWWIEDQSKFDYYLMADGKFYPHDGYADFRFWNVRKENPKLYPNSRRLAIAIIKRCAPGCKIIEN